MKIYPAHKTKRICHTHITRLSRLSTAAALTISAHVLELLIFSYVQTIQLLADGTTSEKNLKFQTTTDLKALSCDFNLQNIFTSYK